MPDSIEKATFFRISLGVWSLVSVTLTNSYNGIMIGELNAPRKVFHPENFDQLSCGNQFEQIANNRWPLYSIVLNRGEFQSDVGKE